MAPASNNSSSSSRPPDVPFILPTIETPDDEGDDYFVRPQHYSAHDGHDALLSPSLFDSNRLSPLASPTYRQPSYSLLNPSMASTTEDGFSNENTAPIGIPTAGNSMNNAAPNPFNFQTQVISTSPVKPSVGQRRGHKYKHSSVSAQHQIFQEPPRRPPLALPRDLPVPTLKEAWKSMSPDQRHRLYWCLCHVLVAVWLFMSAHGSLTMTALSHLVFFDVGSAVICVAVEVLGNFEVWKRSSVRYPFGLERGEVLAGFAMSIFLIFGGFDLVSHNVKHVLEGHGSSHNSHDGHAHEHDKPRVAMGGLDIVSLAAIVATLISAYGLKNRTRISRIMRVSYLASLPSILSNPFHFLTLSISSLLVLLPLFSIHLHIILDSVICSLIAIAMFALGVRLAIAQGLMLLMSYAGRSSSGDNKNKIPDFGVSDVLREIETEPSVERVEEAQFWQVHYGLCMANLKLSVARGCDDVSLSRVRVRIANLIQNRLGEGYGRGSSLKWEVSLQMGSSTSMKDI